MSKVRPDTIPLNPRRHGDDLNSPEVKAARRDAIEHFRQMLREVIDDPECEFCVIALRPSEQCPHDPQHYATRMTFWMTSDHVPEWMGTLLDVMKGVMETGIDPDSLQALLKEGNPFDIIDKMRNDEEPPTDEEGKLKLTPDLEI